MFRWLAKGENCSLIAHAQIFLLAFDYRPHPPYGKHATKRLTPLCAYQCQAPTPLPPQYGRRRALGRDLNFKTCPRVGNLIKRFKIITDHVARDKPQYLVWFSALWGLWRSVWRCNWWNGELGWMWESPSVVSFWLCRDNHCMPLTSIYVMPNV